MLQKVFGANVDWISQHSVFPEYFRQRFYQTGELLPEFAANIGGGQNIYHFAYYGLYNPLMLPAYFLPFVKMSDYIMVISILCLAVDVFLFYKWLRGNEISRGNAAWTSCMFLLAGPVIFHSYNQIMFINYMPFLLLSFIGVDRLFRRGKRGVFICSAFLMILTSFYFSIGGILASGLYGVYRYWSVEEEKGAGFQIKSFFAAGVNFCFSVLTAVLSSGFLLIPTAAALVGGERKGSALQSMASLLIPDPEIFRVIYQPYGIGLTTCIITVLFTGITYKKWSEKYLHIGCILILILPVFSYLLNGGLYIRDKALIPMLPVLCYLMALYLEKQRKKEIPFAAGIVPFLLTLVLVLVGDMQQEGVSFRCLVVLDAGCMLVCGLFYYWKRVEKVFVIVPVVFLIVFGIGLHKTMDRMLDAEFYRQVTDTKFRDRVEELCKQETGFYRLEQNGGSREDAANLNRIWADGQYSSSVYSSVYNADYQKFRQKIFDVEQPFRNVLMQGHSENPIFQRLMGIQYILSDKDVPGYEKKSEGIYEREDVYPIVYGTDITLSQAGFENLTFPYNQLAFLSYGIVPGTGKVEAERLAEKSDENLKEIFVDLDEMKDAGQGEICLDAEEEGDIFFLQFKVKPSQKNKDIWVRVNGIQNKLTAKNHIYYNENEVFTYTAALKKGQTEIPVVFGPGNCEISDVKCYTWKQKEGSPVQSEFLPDQAKTGGNRIAGKIQMKKSGYVITSIPYEKNFTIKADGKEIRCEKVNTAFVGFKLDKGEHEIEIRYHAPGAAAGKLMSIIGLILWCISSKMDIKGRERRETIWIKGLDLFQKFPYN